MREYGSGIEGLVLICVDRIRVLNQYHPRWQHEGWADANTRYLDALYNLYRELFWVHGGLGDPGPMTEEDESNTLRWLVEYHHVNGVK